MGKARSSHKKQHFVPQCYTKAWADPDSVGQSKIAPYVWVFDKDGSNPRRRSPANLFTETDIYTLTRKDGHRDLRLEHGFQDLEDRFTRIRNMRFNKMQWPNAEELQLLFAFVAAAHTRTVGFRDHQREQWGKIREQMELLEAAHGEWTSSGRRAIVRLNNRSTGDDLAIGIDEVREIEANPIQQIIGSFLNVVVPMFSRMSLAVFSTDDPCGFVTSDQPCVWFDKEAYKLPSRAGRLALGSPSIEVTLPISPSHCLALTHSPRLRGFIPLPGGDFDELNKRHIAHCKESFISRSPVVRDVWLRPKDNGDLAPQGDPQE
jgi:hypothetical protein